MNETLDPWSARSADVVRKRNRKGGTTGRVTRQGVAPVVGSIDRTATGEPCDAVWAMVLGSDVDRWDVPSDRFGSFPMLRRRFSFGMNGHDVTRATDRVVIGTRKRPALLPDADVPQLIGSDVTGRAWHDETPADAVYGRPVDPSERGECADPSDAALVTISRAGLDGRAIGGPLATLFPNVPEPRPIAGWPDRFAIRTPRLRASESEHADKLITGCDVPAIRTPVTSTPIGRETVHVARYRPFPTVRALPYQTPVLLPPRARSVETVERVTYMPESNSNRRTLTVRSARAARRIHVGNRTVNRGPLSRVRVQRLDVPAGTIPTADQLRDMPAGDKLRGNIAGIPFTVNRTPDGTRWNGTITYPDTITRFSVRTPHGARRHLDTITQPAPTAATA